MTRDRKHFILVATMPGQFRLHRGQGRRADKTFPYRAGCHADAAFYAVLEPLAASFLDPHVTCIGKAGQEFSRMDGDIADDRRTGEGFDPVQPLAEF